MSPDPFLARVSRGSEARWSAVRLVFPLALAALMLFPALGAAPFERAEIYFMDGARTMVESGDYLVPRFRGEPFFDKPPLTYWLLAGSFHVFGLHPGAGRLVPAVATLGTLLATFWLGSLVLDRRSAFGGMVVLATTVAFVAFGRVAMSDMLLALWSTLALALTAASLHAEKKRWMVPALGAVLGLGFLTKGPVAVLLPGLGMLLLLYRQRGQRALPRRDLASAGLLFLLTGCGWFGLVWLRLGWGPLEYFFLRENLERFAGQTYDAGQPLWYYLPTYLAQGLPWSLFLPLAVLRLWRNGTADPSRRGTRLLAAWVALMLLPLSLSRGKIDYYLLPLYPPLALLLGRVLWGLPWGRLERLWGGAVLAAVAGGLAVVAAFPAPLPPGWLPALPARALLALAVWSGVAAAVAAALRPTQKRIVGLLAVLTAGLFGIVAGFFLPAFRSAQPNAAILQDVLRERRYRPDAGVIACREAARAPRDILFYARAQVHERCDVWGFAASSHPFMILAEPPLRASLAAIPGMREIRTYQHVPATALTLKGLLRFPEPQVLTLLANYPTDDPVALRKDRKERKQSLRRLKRANQPPPKPRRSAIRGGRRGLKKSGQPGLPPLQPVSRRPRLGSGKAPATLSGRLPVERGTVPERSESP